MDTRINNAVTDPELIKRLNAKAGISDQNAPVTDPALIERLNRKAQMEAFKKGINTGPSAALATGMSDISGGLLSNLTGLLNQLPKTNDLVPQEMQKFIPNDDRGAPLDPYKMIGTEDKPITSLGGLLQTAGSLYVPGQAAKQGITKAAEYAPQFLDKVNPGRLASRLEEEIGNQSKAISADLGKGASNTEEVAASISDDIRKLHDAREANARIYFNHVLNQAGKGILYNKANPLISTALDEGKALMSKIDDLNVGDLFKQFESNPTFENAHKLQSELGLMVDELKRVPHKSQSEKLQLGKIASARETLKSDMLNYLENKHPNKNENLAPIWQRGIDLYRDEVAPYLSNKKLREINRGRKKYVDNIHQAFKNPDAADLITREGVTLEGAGSKILKDLPQETKDKILFSRIGAHSGEDTSSLLKKLDNAEKKGYSKYLSPSLKEGIADILSKQNKAEILKDRQQNINKIAKILGIGSGIATGTGFPMYYLAKSLLNENKGSL